MKAQTETPAPYLVPDIVKPSAEALRIKRENAVIARAIHHLETRLRKSETIFSSPDVARSYIRLKIAMLPHEVFCVLFLNAQNGLIAFEEMFRGTLTQTSVYPREVVIKALEHNAAAVVLAHNHPSGTTEPSRADESLTQALKGALSLVDVRVLDHIIVSPWDSMSMAERGLL